MRAIPPSIPIANRRDGFWLILWLALWGSLLGLALWKFGNPIILDRRILAPESLGEAWHQPWPIRWGNGLFTVLALAGLPLARFEVGPWFRRLSVWLWVPPLIWLGWQILSAIHTVDHSLTSATLAQFTGIVAAYGLGLILASERRRLPWLLAGVLVGLCFCLMRATSQRLYEFHDDRTALIEGERTGWTNYPPNVIDAMRQDRLIISTNGVLVANPQILSKLERGRVHGTLVYPNALAGVVLLLLPVALWLVYDVTRPARPATRLAALSLLTLLGGAALFWSGSKSGWLIALGMAGVAGIRLPVPRRWKQGALIALAVGGLLAFAIRFESYFAAGATSVGARFDYWRAAGRTALSEPMFGTGPGTFQRPYARLKSPEAEMARLVHNDYLEQFSDSGFPGGLAYLVWIGAWFVLVGRRIWRPTQESPLLLPSRSDSEGKGEVGRRPDEGVTDGLWFYAFLGTAAWLVQGFSEFSLYVPALAWIAFTMAGALAGFTARENIPSATPVPSSRTSASGRRQ